MRHLYHEVFGEYPYAPVIRIHDRKVKTKVLDDFTEVYVSKGKRFQIRELKEIPEDVKSQKHCRRSTLVVDIPPNTTAVMIHTGRVMHRTYTQHRCQILSFSHGLASILLNISWKSTDENAEETEQMVEQHRKSIEAAMNKVL